MGQNPVPPVNIPIPTKIGPKMGGAPTPKWDPIGFDNHSRMSVSEAFQRHPKAEPFQELSNTCAVDWEKRELVAPCGSQGSRFLRRIVQMGRW